MFREGDRPPKSLNPQKAIANAQEAIASYLEYCQEDGLTPPSPSSVVAYISGDRQ